MKQVRPSLYLLSLSLFAIALFFPGTLSAAPVKSIGYRVVDQAPVIIQGQPGSAPGGTAAMSAEPAVEGFADQVPITVALQQILPQGYGYTLGDGVDPGQLVSWRGGRPWQAVLQDMLAPSGLNYSLNGRSVTVAGAGAASPTIIGGPKPPGAEPVQAMSQPVYTAYPTEPPPSSMAPPPMAPLPPPMMQPPPPMPPPPMQPMPPMMAGVPTPQPLQIENPLIYQPQAWDAHPGQTLRALLQDWCARVGTELRWNAEFDYPVMASLNMTGTFEEAVRVLLSGFDSAKPTPRGRLHVNPAAGQSILIVEASGNNYGE